jgi:hypothetical protein
LKHLSPRWDPTWRRAYGTGLAKHSILLHSNGILPIEVIANTRRKNSADIALVIDVMLAACSDSLDAFCIVSSDGDYTRLALTLREKGKQLLIVGRATTPSSLRSACTEFIDLDELGNTARQTSARNSGLSTVAPSEGEGSGFTGSPTDPRPLAALDRSGGEQLDRRVPSPLQVDAADLIPLIRELTGDHGTTTLGSIQISCARRYADFSPRMCGATKWRPLLRRMAVFTVEPIKSKGGKIQDYTVGFRPAATVPEALAE